MWKFNRIYFKKLSFNVDRNCFNIILYINVKSVFDIIESILYNNAFLN